MTFPRLKTGAIAQYGITEGRSRKTRVLKYADGSEKRFAVRRSGRRWVLRLSLLDEGEAAELDAFFLAMRGMSQEFAFEDPRTGTLHERCRFVGESLGARFTEGGRGGMEIEIAEVTD